MNIAQVSKIKTLIFIAIIVFSHAVSAQKTHTYHSPGHEYKLAVELFEKEQYGSAKNMFSKVYHAIDNKYDLQKQSSLYHIAVCAVFLYHEDAEKSVLFFMNEYPEYPHIQRLWFYLGNYYFEKRQYRRALEAYENTEIRVLETDEYMTYLFKKGYSYFMQDDFANAKPLLKQASEKESQYKNKAVFYYSHILYAENSHNAALKGFEQLKNEAAYSEIVPFYIAHIYYATQRYQDLVDNANELVGKSSAKRISEIYRLIAHSYFQLRQYDKAIPYFEDYFSTVQTAVACDDYYMAGYAYYSDKQYSQAIERLKKGICENDTLNQHAYYALGDAYLQVNQKEFASQSFLSAYNLKINQTITEDALFEYAKLQYELSSNPFVSAISAFELYLNEYAHSQRKNEVESYLSTIYLTTKNYKSAVASLEKINNKSVVLLRAYQRVTYFRGLELFNDGLLDEADRFLETSSLNNFDPVIYAQALFWKAEITYRKGDYAAARNGYNLFLSLQQAKFTTEYPMAFYNGGYSYFKLKDYSLALTKFLEFQKLSSLVQNQNMVADACNRAGDCYFMLSQLPEAIVQYDKVIEKNIYNADYALYQRAQSEGGLRQFDKKIQTMQLLTTQYPRSPYVTEAEYEVANTYFARGQNKEALATYQSFVQKNPRSPLVKTVMLKMGSIYYNTEQDDKALEVFKKVIADYPNTEESSLALKNIENIYTASGNVDEFFAYVRGVSFANITASYQDSVMYNSAAEKFFNKKFTEAEKDFDNYIHQFPDGIFIVNAHYFMAECAFMRSDKEKALRGYKMVIQSMNEHFLATSLLNAATILYDAKQYDQALPCYALLEQKAILPSQKTDGNIGRARCYWALQQYDSAIVVAKYTVSDEKASTEMQEEAKAIIARAAMALNNLDEAEKYYTALSKQNKSEIVSEALYHLTYIEYKRGNLNQAEKKIFEVLTNISHDYWLAKSYILLGDIYLEKGNSFQAKHTYLSIMENYDGEDLVQIATEKYNKILSAENAVEQEQKQQNSDTDKNNEDNIQPTNQPNEFDEE
ncbi:MAG: tetratricopeptide repeat protein [Bacteroidales bacterium]|jgi:tetratricopeptide (TPR) repeat protein|nr:tetratricopeptide repeat protein [Bacteroidales bacterium]